MTQEVAFSLQLTPGAVHALLRKARAVDNLPLVGQAHARGELNDLHIRVITDLCEASDHGLAEWEELLVEYAGRMEGREFTRTAAMIRHTIDELRERNTLDQYRRRRLRLASRLDGMVRIEGLLDPESGETVITAIGAIIDHDRGRDLRSPDQARSDALTEICRTYLDQGDRPGVNGERPHLTVLVDLATLEGRAGHGTPRCSIAPSTSSPPSRPAVWHATLRSPGSSPILRVCPSMSVGPLARSRWGSGGQSWRGTEPVGGRGLAGP